MFRVERVLVEEIKQAQRDQLLEITEPYYERALIGLEKELKIGDFVYFIRDEKGGIGAFLIVKFSHAKKRIERENFVFTYLGLGCAKTKPMVPIFLRVRDDALKLASEDESCVLHLTTSTPFAYKAIVKAFSREIYPPEDQNAIPAQFEEVARYLKTDVHPRTTEVRDESPFVLRSINKGRFKESEIKRIRGFGRNSPIFNYEIDQDNGDELIVFHVARSK